MQRGVNVNMRDGNGDGDLQVCTGTIQVLAMGYARMGNMLYDGDGGMMQLQQRQQLRTSSTRQHLQADCPFKLVMGEGGRRAEEEIT